LTEDVSHDEFAVQQALKYSPHIRTIRLLLDHQFEVKTVKDCRPIHERCLINTLALCTQVTSISVYCQFPGEVPPQCRPSKNFRRDFFEVLSRKDRVPLSSLGVYLLPGFYRTFGRTSDNITWFLDQMLSSTDILQYLEHFDIMTQHFPPATIISLPSLTSFSLRGPSIGSLEMESISNWFRGSKLIRLHLLRVSIHVETLQNCLRTCSSLQILLLSSCTISSIHEYSSPTNFSGWSKHPAALHRPLKPLQCLHIEHPFYHHIIRLGVVPTTRLIVSRLRKHELEKAFLQDEELFPNLESVSLEKNLKPKEGSLDESTWNILKQIWQKRGVQVYYNATCCIPDTL
jgi:hypothetical protein